MSTVLHHLAQWDQTALEQSQGLRWGPVTALFVLASAWWVKGLAFVTVGALGDLRARRFVPATTACTAMAAVAAAATAAVVKELVDRARPALADPAINPLVATPDNPSFPSGHAATAFAAAAVVTSFHPGLRWPLYALAALVALSRIYLGVHYSLDVLAGALLGLAIGLSAAWASRRILRRYRVIR